MSVLPVGIGSSGVDVGDIGHSLRLRSAASASLSRTFGVPTDNKKWTWSGWIKRGLLGAASGYRIFGANDGTTNNNSFLSYYGDNLRFYLRVGGSTILDAYTTAVYRDPSAWGHVVFVYDSANGTAGNRYIIYVDGVVVAWGSVTGSISLNQVSILNTNAYAHYHGQSMATEYLDGYLSRIAFIDGQALTPDSFGYFNTEINEWVSKTKQQIRAAIAVGGGTRNGWGANGCMENFEDATSLTTLGYDTSQADDGTGGNHWTCNNISLTAGVTYDHMLDVPGNSFATLNPILVGRSDGGGASWSATQANLYGPNANGSGGWGMMGTTIAIPSGSGKYYFECQVGATGQSMSVGVQKVNTPFAAPYIIGYTGDANGYSYTNDGYKWNNGSTAYGSASSAGDIIGIAIDSSGATTSITYYKNGVSMGVAFTGITGDLLPAASSVSGAGNCYFNFGQHPFAYTPPTGFLALNQANLPAIDPATLLDPTDHHIDITVTKSGNTNFTLPWDASVYDTLFEIKRRDAAGDWYQIDGLRGYDKILKSNSTAAETTDANVLGISGTTGTLKSTLSDGTYIVSATKAGLTASRQTNTDGTITSTVSRNVDSGFAIVTYTGTGANATVGHGLGAVVKYYMVKTRGVVSNWAGYHVGISSAATQAIYLNLTNAANVDTTMWNSTAPTSTVFSLGTSGTINTNTSTYVAYCYTDSDIQKSFSYTGSGNADGPYVNLGFKCGRILEKVSNVATYSWCVFDSVRDKYNVVRGQVYMNLNNAENTGGDRLDMTSFGYKYREAGNNNNSGNIIIGHAWAATTGKFSNAR